MTAVKFKEYSLWCVYYIIVSAMSKYKKSKFKYNGIELEGYSADEIEKILTVIAQKNDLLKGNSKKGNV